MVYDNADARMKFIEDGTDLMNLGRFIFNESMKHIDIDGKINNIDKYISDNINGDILTKLQKRECLDIANHAIIVHTILTGITNEYLKKGTSEDQINKARDLCKCWIADNYIVNNYFDILGIFED